MSRYLALAIIALSMSAIAKDDNKPVYVGGGRWACSGNSYECAQVRANNRAQEERERQRYERQAEEGQQRWRDVERDRVRYDRKP